MGTILFDCIDSFAEVFVHFIVLDVVIGKMVACKRPIRVIRL